MRPRPPFVQKPNMNLFRSLDRSYCDTKVSHLVEWASLGLLSNFLGFSA